MVPDAEDVDTAVKERDRIAEEMDRAEHERNKREAREKGSGLP
jgi:hypothetical protein